MKQTRRDFCRVGALGALGSFMSGNPLRAGDGPERPLHKRGEYVRINSAERQYHISCSLDMFDQYDDLPELWRESGVTDAWLCTWFYGYFPYPQEKQEYWIDRLQKAGLRVHFISVPFCHGGGALDPRSSDFPNLPPEDWKIAKRWDGSENWGFSWHSPADSAGAEALKTLWNRYGVYDMFLDDDFRFASAPGVIGGCVCDECRADFLRKSGVSESRWDEVLDDVRNSADTPLLRAWVDYFCDRLTQCFHTYQSAVPEADLGIMVMYMGCERGGIRLDDYRDALFRVGEGGFNDAWYNPVKTKTIELYSSLFHRRFCSPGRAFSETTVFPEKSLSAENMASKLSISTLSDVRNTCFMSGLVPIDPPHWSVLAPRMKHEKELHDRLKDAVPRGPFKHYYGTSARYCAGENAYSLFLALGVPFEVCDKLPDDGYVFLSDADARAVDRGSLELTGARLVARFDSGADRFARIDEDFEPLFEFRRAILMELQEKKIPYVEEEIPMVVAHYPDNNLVYLWNPAQEDAAFHIRRGDKLISMKLAALDSTLVDLGMFE